MFSRDEFAVMAERLGRLQGRFILSINDTPQMRDLFGSFEPTRSRCATRCQVGARVQARELIICGGVSA